MESAALNSLAALAMSRNEIGLALGLLRNALELATATEYRYLEGPIRRQLAKALRLSGDLAAAAVSAAESAKILTELMEAIELGETLLEQAEIALAGGQDPSAFLAQAVATAGPIAGAQAERIRTRAAEIRGRAGIPPPSPPGS